MAQNAVVKLNINKCTFDELQEHTALTDSHINTILNFRDKNAPLTEMKFKSLKTRAILAILPTLDFTDEENAEQDASETLSQRPTPEATVMEMFQLMMRNQEKRDEMMMRKQEERDQNLLQVIREIGVRAPLKTGVETGITLSNPLA
jgi:hypothetical protein